MFFFSPSGIYISKPSCFLSLSGLLVSLHVESGGDGGDDGDDGDDGGGEAAVAFIGL